MAIVNVTSTAWSEAVVLDADETWQCSSGAIMLNLNHEGEEGPDLNDGVLLPYPMAINLNSGESVLYRLFSPLSAQLTRQVRA